MAAGEYLEDEAMFTLDRLIEPIRKSSISRMVVPYQTTLNPSDNQAEITTVEDDFNIIIDLEVTQNKRSHQYVNRNTYTVPVIEGLLQYTHDELQRIQQSGKPIQSRINDLGNYWADRLDAMSFAASTTGVRDGDHQALVENGTSVAFDMSSYANFKSSVGTYIGTVADTFGNLADYPLLFVYNTQFLQTALGLTNSTSDREAMEYLDAALMKHGAPGSMSMHSERLGCALTTSSMELTITNEADEACALFVRSPNNYGGWDSPLDPRLDTPVNKNKGYKNTIVQRVINRVHKAGSILYDIDATP